MTKRNAKHKGLAQAMERRVERIPDPDYPHETIVHESFTFTYGGKGPARPATSKDIAALRAMHDQQRIPTRLENDRRGILMISGTPEQTDAEALLEKAEGLWRQVQDPSVALGLKNPLGDQLLVVLDSLSDAIRHGLRRKDDRQTKAVVRAGRRAGGQQAGAGRKIEAAAREAHLKVEAMKIRTLHPSWPVSELARSLSERQDLGGFQAIYRKLLRLLRD